MYLSKIILDSAHPQARRDLADAYEMHRTLSRVFAEGPERAPLRFLWRREESGARLPTDGAVVLVQSAEPGRWESLIRQDGYCEALHPNKKIDLAGLVAVGRPFVFRLLCNPTVTREGKRYGLARAGEQLSWLDRQGSRHGFELAEAEVRRSERISVRQGTGGNRITLQAVQFDGLLQVADAEKLRRALLDGIGPAKALGFGLLSLAPRG